MALRVLAALVAGAIPRVIMQSGPANRTSWEASYRRGHESWRRFHPAWRYVFWTDDDPAADNPYRRAFVARRYSWFAPAWDRLCWPIQRYDVARIMWLHAYGGVYVDLDVEATASIEPFLTARVMVVANSPGHAALRNCLRGRCGAHHGNWLMASERGHPLWMEHLRYIAAHVDTYCAQDRVIPGVTELTGPYALARVIAASNESVGFFPLHPSFATVRFTARWFKHQKWRVDGAGAAR